MSDLGLLRAVIEKAASEDDRWVEADQAVAEVLAVLRDLIAAEHTDLWKAVYTAIKTAYLPEPPSWD